MVLACDARRAHGAAVTERRRPGRIAYQNPELVGLLRTPLAVRDGLAGDALPGVTEGDVATELGEDPLRSAKGIATALLLSGGCWFVVGAAIWLLLKV